MGVTLGKLSTTVAEPNTSDVINNDRQVMSKYEMDKEFDDIYQRSNAKLKSLVMNPCKELEQRIAECLQNNSMQIKNSIKTMDLCKEDAKEDAMAQMLETVATIKEN